MDQAMEYTAAIGAMAMDEMAMVNERMDTRIGNDLNLRDVRMDEIQEEVTDMAGRVDVLDKRMDGVMEELVDHNERILQLTVENQDLRREVDHLYHQFQAVDELMDTLRRFQVAHQHRPENLIVVEDNEEAEEEEVEVEVFNEVEVLEIPAKGRHVPIEDIPGEEAARRDPVLEFPYPAPPSYVDAPLYEE